MGNHASRQDDSEHSEAEDMTPAEMIATGIERARASRSDDSSSQALMENHEHLDDLYDVAQTVQTKQHSRVAEEMKLLFESLATVPKVKGTLGQDKMAVVIPLESAKIISTWLSDKRLHSDDSKRLSISFDVDFSNGRMTKATLHVFKNNKLGRGFDVYTLKANPGARNNRGGLEIKPNQEVEEEIKELAGLKKYMTRLDSTDSGNTQKSLQTLGKILDLLERFANYDAMVNVRLVGTAQHADTRQTLSVRDQHLWSDNRATFKVTQRPHVVEETDELAWVFAREAFGKLVFKTSASEKHPKSIGRSFSVAAKKNHYDRALRA